MAYPGGPAGELANELAGVICQPLPGILRNQ
jgi:hypothetical protein